jgi:hypothetical protein
MLLKSRASAVACLPSLVVLIAVTSSIAAAQDLRWKTVKGILRTGDKWAWVAGKSLGEFHG